jgi:hypothetical protein
MLLSRRMSVGGNVPDWTSDRSTFKSRNEQKIRDSKRLHSCFTDSCWLCKYK